MRDKSDSFLSEDYKHPRMSSCPPHDEQVLSPEGRVIQPHHGHGVFKSMLLLSRHVDDEEGDEGREGQDQVDGNEGVGKLLHLHRAGLAHHDHAQAQLVPHGSLRLHLYANTEATTNQQLQHRHITPRDTGEQIISDLDDGSIDTRLEVDEAGVPVVSSSAVDRVSKAAGCKETRERGSCVKVYLYTRKRLSSDRFSL